MTPEEEVAALKAATREAHEAIKDLRIEIKNASIIKDALLVRLAEAFADGVDAVIKDGLDRYADTIRGAIVDAQKAVYDRFDQLADVLLGEDRATRRSGKKSLVDFAQEIRSRKEQAHE